MSAQPCRPEGAPLDLSLCRRRQYQWHAEMRYQGHLIMFGKSGAYGGKTQATRQSQIDSPINLYLYCENVDEFYEHALKMGAR